MSVLMDDKNNHVGKVTYKDNTPKIFFKFSFFSLFAFKPFSNN